MSESSIEPSVGGSGPSVHALAIQVAKLEERLDQEKRSLIKRVSVWGALVALVISVSTGAFSLYDSFVLRPQEERAASGSELRQIVGRISTINTKLTEAQLERDPSRLRALAMAANAEKATLLSRADEIVAQASSQASFPDYIMLSYESLNFGNSAKAVSHAKAAFEVAETEQFKGEAHRHIAIALFSPGPEQDLDAARGHFDQSIEVSRAAGGVGSEALVLNVYVDWVVAEAAVVGCDSARKIYGRLEADLQATPAPASIVTASIAAIEQGLATNSRCTGIVKPAPAS